MSNSVKKAIDDHFNKSLNEFDIVCNKVFCLDDNKENNTNIKKMVNSMISDGIIPDYKPNKHKVVVTKIFKRISVGYTLDEIKKVEHLIVKNGSILKEGDLENIYKSYFIYKKS